MKKALVVTALSAGIAAAGAGVASAHDADARGKAVQSPGVASGNTVQVPVHVPVNVCGDSISVVGILNPAFGNVCHND
nr:chaplin [Streptomyces sp. SID5468]